MIRPLRLALLLGVLIASAAQADVIRLLDDPHQAVQARVDLIQQAQHQIDVVYFLTRNDRVGLTALALLREAQRRGVATRLVVDASFQHIPKPVLSAVREEGVQIRVYHPLTLRHPTWTYRRMHEKVIIADCRRYITGGRNLAAGYFGLAKKNFVDRDVYVDGASATEAQAHFEELWASDEVADLRVRVTADERAGASRLLDSFINDLQCGDGFVALDTGNELSAGLADSGTVAFLVDPLEGGSGPRVGERLTALLSEASQSIVLESPYVVPSRPLLELIEAKCAEGVRVQILTNSLKSTDGLLPYVAYLRYRRRLLRAGVAIYEFNGPDVLHAKSMVIDDRIALVGSYNLDPRSHNLNAEVMCVVEDPALAKELLQSIDAHVANSTAVARHAHRARTLRMWVTGVLARMIEGQL